MKKSLIFWTEAEWEASFYKGDGWTVRNCIPTRLYANKQHIKDLNKKDWRENGEKMFKDYRKIRITIEDIK